MQNDGWDVVFACSAPCMNKRLKEEAEKYTFGFRYEDTGVILSGEFSSWSIAPDGSGEIIQFHTPIKNGSATIKSNDKTYKLDGAVPLVQLQLQFVDGDEPGKEKNLVFHCKTVGSKEGDRTPGAVTVVNPDTKDQAGLDPVAEDLIASALAKSLVNNRDKLAFVFANIGLAPPKDAHWMKVRTLDYGYQQDEKGELGSFGVVGMLDDRNVSDKTKAFDSHLLREGDDFAFMLSGDKLLSHVILPGLPKGFKGSSASEFKYEHGKIVNNGQIHLDSVKVGAIWYPPHIDTLNMHIEGDYISTYLSGKCPITGLTDAHINFSMSEKEVAHFDVHKESLSFSAEEKRVSHSTHIPWWEKILGGLTLGLMNAIVGVITLALEHAVGSRVSGSGLDVANLGAFQVSWQPGEDSRLTDGGLADNFYCRGMLK